MKYGRHVILALSALYLSQASGLEAQPLRGSFRGIDSMYAKAERRDSLLVRPLVGTAEWHLEVDSLDWRPKWTIRVALVSPDRGVLVIRWATGVQPALGGYRVKNIATGNSHVDPRFVTASLLVKDSERTHAYLIGSSLDSVFIEAETEGGVVRGRLRVHPERYADGPHPSGPIQYVHRVQAGTFEAARGALMPLPPITADLQENILTQALFGFAITWSGAINGDGYADSTRSVANARTFLIARWGEALVIDSLATNDKDFYLAVHGKLIPVVCTMTPHDLEPACRAPRR